MNSMYKVALILGLHLIDFFSILHGNVRDIETLYNYFQLNAQVILYNNNIILHLLSFKYVLIYYDCM